MSINSEFLTLLDNVAGAGNGSAVTWKGGKGSFYAEGTVIGTVLLQAQTDQGTWVPVAGVTLDDNGVVFFELAPGLVRGVHSGANTAVFASVVRL